MLMSDKSVIETVSIGHIGVFIGFILVLGSIFMPQMFTEQAANIGMILVLVSFLYEIAMSQN